MISDHGRDALIKMLTQEEQYRKYPYQDSEGNWTVGIGRNLQSDGVSKDEAIFMLNNDIDEAVEELKKKDIFAKLSEERKIVLIDMCFNLGFAGIMQFRKMWESLAVGDYKKASQEMLDSKWAHQVGNRAARLALIMETGKL